MEIDIARMIKELSERPADRKAYNLRISKAVMHTFRRACQESEPPLRSNEAIEYLMRRFAEQLGTKRR